MLMLLFAGGSICVSIIVAVIYLMHTSTATPSPQPTGGPVTVPEDTDAPTKPPRRPKDGDVLKTAAFLE